MTSRGASPTLTRPIAGAIAILVLAILVLATLVVASGRAIAEPGPGAGDTHPVITATREALQPHGHVTSAVFATDAGARSTIETVGTVDEMGTRAWQVSKTDAASGRLLFKTQSFDSDTWEWYDAAYTFIAGRAAELNTTSYGAVLFGTRYPGFVEGFDFRGARDRGNPWYWASHVVETRAEGLPEFTPGQPYLAEVELDDVQVARDGSFDEPAGSGSASGDPFPGSVTTLTLAADEQGVLTSATVVTDYTGSGGAPGGVTAGRSPGPGPGVVSYSYSFGYDPTYPQRPGAEALMPVDDAQRLSQTVVNANALDAATSTIDTILATKQGGWTQRRFTRFFGFVIGDRPVDAQLVMKPRTEGRRTYVDLKAPAPWLGGPIVATYSIRRGVASR